MRLVLFAGFFNRSATLPPFHIEKLKGSPLSFSYMIYLNYNTEITFCFVDPVVWLKIDSDVPYVFISDIKPP